MVLLEAPGWQESWGIRQELLFCQEFKIPVFKMSPHEIYENLQDKLSNPLTPDIAL